MKLSKLMNIALGAILLYIVLLQGAFAADQWYTCSVLKLGPGGSDSYIKLTEVTVQGVVPAFQGRWFRLSSDRAREMLAVGITAISSSMKVQIYVDGDVEFSDIRAMYLVNE